MIIERIPVGNLEANCYIVGCEETKKAAVIDPGDEGERILERLHKLGLEAVAILLTHGHVDHIGAVEQLKKATGTPVMIHTQDGEMLTNPSRNLSAWMGAQIKFDPADRLLEEGDRLNIGNLTLEVIHTPGHTPGGLCFKVGQELFTGDTLFAQSVGRSDFPGGNHSTLIEGIKSKLLILDESLKVYPGHGATTTIGQEKRHNPYL